MEKLTFKTNASACRFEVKGRKKFDTATFPDVPPNANVEPETEEPPVLIGYAITWNTLSDDRGGYHASFAKEGFTPDPGGMLALFGHDLNMPMGNTANGTLTYTPDEYGLKVEITPPDTSFGNDAVELVSKGYLQGMSFGMYPEEWTDSEKDGKNVRLYTKFSVDEVSLTAGPAFKSTNIGIELSKSTPIRIDHALRLEAMRFENISV
jgi:HK97 family phage prohead protease